MTSTNLFVNPLPENRKGKRKTFTNQENLELSEKKLRKDAFSLAKFCLNAAFKRNPNDPFTQNIIFHQGDFYTNNGQNKPWKKMPKGWLKGEISRVLQSLRGDGSVNITKILVDSIIFNIMSPAIAGTDICKDSMWSKFSEGEWVDQKDTILPFKNGFLFLYDVKNLGCLAPLNPYSSNLFIPYSFDVNYDPNQKCPKLDEALFHLCPSEEFRLRVLEALGSYFVVDTSMEHFHYWYGRGANGKSFMVKLGQLMIGKGLYSTVPLSSIGQRFRDLPLLYSVVNIDSELGSSIPTSSEAALKQVVSGDPRDFERKYGETVTGIVRAKFVFIGNELISVKDRSDGFWRRLQLFHFSRTIPEDKRIPDLEKIIFSEESSGVLNLLLDGIKRLYEQKGLTIDPESQSLFTEYKEQANPDYGFINTFLSLEKDSKVCLGDLYKSYSTFVASHSLTPSNLQHFRSALLGAFPIPKISFSKIRCEGKENPVACVLGLKFDIKRFNDEVGQESQTFVPSIFPGVPS